MYNETYQNFLVGWDNIIVILSYIFLAGSILTSLYYFINVLRLSNPKVKYDYINESEIKLFWRSMLLLTISGGLYLNTIFDETVRQEVIWFFVRLFVTASFTTIFALIFNSLIKVYYPFQVQKKLNKLRHIPRINPNNGKEMKLLSEEVEDDYLDAKMIEEEASHHVDYDVWLDESTGFTIIEKYDGASLAIECPSCGYRTLRVVNEEVIKSPTLETEGELLNYYQCSYCSHKERKTIITKKLAAKSTA